MGCTISQLWSFELDYSSSHGRKLVPLATTTCVRRIQYRYKVDCSCKNHPHEHRLDSVSDIFYLFLQMILSSNFHLGPMLHQFECRCRGDCHFPIIPSKLRHQDYNNHVAFLCHVANCSHLLLQHKNHLDWTLLHGLQPIHL